MVVTNRERIKTAATDGVLWCRRHWIRCCIAIGVVVLFYGFWADVKTPLFSRLEFFLTALIVLASLYDIYDRKEGEAVQNAKLETLMSDVRAIATVHGKQAHLELTIVEPANGTCESTHVDLTAIAAALEAKIPPAVVLQSWQRPLFGPSPEQERRYSIAHALWDYRQVGLCVVKVRLYNGGDVAADNIDLFLKLHSDLKPAVELPREPVRTQLEEVALHGIKRQVEDHPRLTVKQGYAELHWRIPSLNPGISIMKAFLIEPGATDGIFPLSYSISTKSSGKSTGKLSLTVKKVMTVSKPG